MAEVNLGAYFNTNFSTTKEHAQIRSPNSSMRQKLNKVEQKNKKLFNKYIIYDA